MKMQKEAAKRRKNAKILQKDCGMLKSHFYINYFL